MTSVKLIKKKKDTGKDEYLILVNRVFGLSDCVRIKEERKECRRLGVSWVGVSVVDWVMRQIRG